MVLLVLIAAVVVLAWWNGYYRGRAEAPEEMQERWWRDPVTGVRATFPFPGAMPETAAREQEQRG